MADITQGIRSKMLQGFDERSFDQFASIVARFPHLSYPQIASLYLQIPDASELGSSAYWREQGVFPLDGEKPIGFLLPSIEQGVVKYKPVGLFDISQTDAEHGGIPYHEDISDRLFELVRETTGYSLTTGPISIIDDETKTISMKDDEAKINKTFLLLTVLIKKQMYGSDADDIAVGITRILAKRWQLEIPNRSIGSLFSYSNTELEFKLKIILKSSSEIITDVEKNKFF